MQRKSSVSIVGKTTPRLSHISYLRQVAFQHSTRSGISTPFFRRSTVLQVPLPSMCLNQLDGINVSVYASACLLVLRLMETSTG